MTKQRWWRGNACRSASSLFCHRSSARDHLPRPDETHCRHGAFPAAAGVAALRRRGRHGGDRRPCGARHRGAAGGRRRCADVRQRGRPALSAAGGTRGAGGDGRGDRRAQAAAAGAVRSQLSLGSGGERGVGGSDRGQLRPRDLHRALCLGHGPVGAALRRGAAAARQPGPARYPPALQRQCRIRDLARYPAGRGQGEERRLLIIGRRTVRVGADDRRGGRD